jgi:2-aminoethylphosphonate-pyruvate transaminase
MTERVRKRLVGLLEGNDGYTAVPLQGSGTFAVEGMIATVVPPAGGLLVLENGAYGRRVAEICRRLGRRHRVLSWPEDELPPLGEIAAALANDASLTHVAAIHVETTSGIANPIREIAEVVERSGRPLLIDAMSAFGALPVNADAMPFVALAASANKCLEGVPGVGFVIVREEILARCQGNAPSLSLDVYDQWRGFETSGQWRFTPPTHVVAALDAALDGLDQEGGVAARGARYARNCAVLRESIAAIGFLAYLPDHLQAPIIVTFRMPDAPGFNFSHFYNGLYRRGFAIYPGKITAAESFRIGCIGAVTEADMRGVAAAAADTLEEMGVSLQ